MTSTAPPKKSSLIHTYQSRNFSAIIVDDRDNPGWRKLKLESPMYYQHSLNKFKTNDKVTLSLTNKRPKRTDSQNRYYWGVYLPLIAEETGEQDLDSLHELFKGKFLTTKLRKVLGLPTRITKSTTELSVVEFIEYIIAIEALTGVAAPPTENYSLAPLHASKK